MIGALPLTTSSFYMSTIVLKSLDYARGTLDIYGPGPENRKARLALEASLAKMGRMALGVSATASRPGVLAELGWLSDAVRGARECLLFLNQLWTMPVGSLAHNCAHQGHAKLLTSYCAGVLQAAGLPVLLLQGSRDSVKRAIKTSLPDLARREWRQKMQADPQATLYARYRHTLRPPPFTALPTFRGRITLIKARLNDLKIGLSKLGWVKKCGTCGMCNKPVPAGAGSNGPTGTEQMYHFFLGCDHSTLLRLRAPFFLDARANWLGADWLVLSTRGQLARLLLLEDNKPGANSTRAIRATGRYLQDVRDKMFAWGELQARRRKAARRASTAARKAATAAQH